MKVYAFQACYGELAAWSVELRERAVLRLGELSEVFLESASSGGRPVWPYLQRSGRGRQPV